MILLVSSGTKKHCNRVNDNLDKFGCFVSPRCYSSISRTTGIIGADNDCFNSSYSDESFLSLVNRLAKYKERLKFIAVPDVPFNDKETLKKFYVWYETLKDFNLPLALVTQDEMLTKDIPWNKIQALFIGGSTEWKLSTESVNIIKEGQKKNKWIHVGRVNTPSRITLCKMLNVDSIDGTGFSMFADVQIKMYEQVISQDVLFYL